MRTLLPILKILLNNPENPVQQTGLGKHSTTQLRNEFCRVGAQIDHMSVRFWSTQTSTTNGSHAFC
jgi:hypothetical protein